MDEKDLYQKAKQKQKRSQHTCLSLKSCQRTETLFPFKLSLRADWERVEKLEGDG